MNFISSQNLTCLARTPIRKHLKLHQEYEKEEMGALVYLIFLPRLCSVYVQTHM